MAKGQKEKEVKKGGKSKVKLGFIIFFIVLALILTTLISLIKFDAFGIGTKLSNSLGNIPIIKNILPAKDGEQTNLSKEELTSLNQSLEETNVSYSEMIDSLNSKIEELNAEITRLREIEDAQVQFKSDKEEFDRMIALNDPSAYTSFYESVSPENAETLYQEAVSKTEYTKEFKDYAQTFENMKKDSAATVLEELISSDIDLVVRILEYLSSDKRADILSAMDSKNAALCIKRMTP